MIKKKSSQSIEVRKNMRQGEGEITIRHYLNKEEINAKCRLCAELTIPAGSSIGLHEHIQEDEIFIIQQGKGIVLDQGKEAEVEAGDVILTGKGAAHTIRNIGEVNLVITAIIMQY
jgi:mannose-6-phosphate isomerase-like protein (cupin superfamily)